MIIICILILRWNYYLRFNYIIKSYIQVLVKTRQFIYQIHIPTLNNFEIHHDLRDRFLFLNHFVNYCYKFSLILVANL